MSPTTPVQDRRNHPSSLRLASGKPPTATNNPQFTLVSSTTLASPCLFFDTPDPHQNLSHQCSKGHAHTITHHTHTRRHTPHASSKGALAANSYGSSQATPAFSLTSRANPCHFSAETLKNPSPSSWRHPDAGRRVLPHPSC